MRGKRRHTPAGYLTPADTASRLDVHQQTVYRYIREGRFEGCIQTGGGAWLIPEAEVDAWRPLPRGPVPQDGVR